MANTDWKLQHKITDFAGDSDPNAVAPSALKVFSTGDRYYPEPSSLVLYATGTGTVSFNIWVNEPSIGIWLSFLAITLSVGSVQKVNLPPNARTFFQVTGKTGVPTALYAGVMPTDGSGTGTGDAQDSTLQLITAAIAANGAASPASVVQEGGVAGVPGTSAPAATTAGKLKALWVGLAGELVSRLVGPDGLDLFSSAAAPSDVGDPTEKAPSIRSRLMAFNDTVNKYRQIREGILSAGAALTVATGFQNIIPTVRYLATRPPLADGNLVELQGNSRGDAAIAEQFAPNAEDGTNQVIAYVRKYLAVSNYSAIVDSSYGTVSAKVVKTVPGSILSITALNTSGGPLYLQVHNKATIPLSTEVPKWVSWLVPAGASITIGTEFFTENGSYCSFGIGWAMSAVPERYTAPGVGTGYHVSVQMSP